ncbi:MAG: RelA/SpoT domain-containing protein [Treponemataceae bacterium]|nr:MAG: RelA/SpoT domain-containing protein [Treponemataceae bacterium]
MHKTESIPDQKKLRELYHDKIPLLNFLLNVVQERLSAVIQLPSSPAFKGRIKEFHGYYKKLLKLRSQTENVLPFTNILPASNGALPLYDSPELPLITDLLGIRIVCAFLEDLNTVASQIAQNFTVLEVEQKGAEQTFREFGYESVHVLIKLPSGALSASSAPPGIKEKIDSVPAEWLDHVVCEIQIRTILQDAWAEVEHELIYKSEFSPFDLPLRRKLASINASLTLADIIFQEIRDYQNKLNSEVDFRRNAFYSKTDTLTRDERLVSGIVENDSFASLQDKVSVSSPFVRGTIDDLVLEAIHAHNAGNFDAAIDIYTRIINYDPRPSETALSVIYKHRGMAHFAQSDYGSALDDFESSIAHNAKSFRSMYYMGIVYSLQEKYEKAVEYFEKSLSINNYQAHVHYRLASVKFKLGEYQESLVHLDDSSKLGLESDDTKSLRAKLVEKFDMK